MTIQPSTQTADLREEELFQECAQNILKNLEKAIGRQKEPPNKISQLLSMKWFIENDLNETN